MDKSELRQLLTQLTGADPQQRDAARLAILRLDEDAVELLDDEFYSGVNEATGLAILRLLSEIGGPEALNTLSFVHEIEARYPSWRDAAAHGLADNGRSDILQ